MDDNKPEQRKPFFGTVKGYVITLIVGSLLLFLLMTGNLGVKTPKKIVFIVLLVFAAVLIVSFAYRIAKDKQFSLKKVLTYALPVVLVYAGIIFLVNLTANIFTALLALAAGIFSFLVVYGALYRENTELRLAFVLGLFLITLAVFLFFPSVLMTRA